jgi:hypothetical protein
LPSSGSKNKPSKKLVRKEVARRALLAICSRFISSFALFFNPDDKGKMFVRKVGWISADYMALHPRRYICYSFVEQ